MSFFFSPAHTHAFESLILNSFFSYSEPCTIKLPNWSHSARIKHPRAQDPAKDLFQEHLPLLHICCISHWCSPGLRKQWKVPVLMFREWSCHNRFSYSPLQWCFFWLQSACPSRRLADLLTSEELPNTYKMRGSLDICPEMIKIIAIFW